MGFRSVYFLVIVLFLSSCQVSRTSQPYDSFESEEEIPFQAVDTSRNGNRPYPVDYHFCGNKLNFGYAGYIDTKVRLLPRQGIFAEDCISATTMPSSDSCRLTIDPNVVYKIEFTRKGQAPQTAVLSDTCQDEEIVF